MSRSLPTALQDAVLAPVVRPFMAVMLDYPSGPVRLCSLPRGQTLAVDGNYYHGTGVLGRLSALEEGAENRSYGFSLALSGIPGTWGSYLRAQDVQGRLVRVYVGAVDDLHEVLAAQLIKVGRMDTQDVQIDSTTTSIKVNCEDVLVDWERARVRRCTDADHRARYPTDGYFKYVAAMQNITLQWGRSK